jgi:hypothetical protein
MAPHLYPDPPFSALSDGQSTPRRLRLVDDVIMQVFHYYRLDLIDRVNWNQERWWYKLTHICRTWRYLILSHSSYFDLHIVCTYGTPVIDMFTHSSHFNLHIVCTYGTPVIDMLTHSRPFRLIINYPNQNTEITADDEEGLLFALRYHNHVGRISLTVSNTNCNRVLAAMDGDFPELRHLRITFNIKNDPTSILPATFRASRLSSLILIGSSHPTGAPLSLTTITAIHLADLTIRGLLPSPDFHPEYLVTQLSSMPLLTTVSLGFRSPIPNRDIKKQLLNLPTTHLLLSHLTKFMFQGVSSFLEGLLDRISTPLLEKFGINFFNQLTFSLPHLSRFICTTPRLKLPIARVNFKKDHISIIVDDNALHQYPAFLRINVDCQYHGWQVDAAAQICNAMAPVLSVVHELTLRFRKHRISSNNEDEVDFTKWHDLLRPFTRVEILRVLHPMLARELFCALQSHDGECHQDVLPQLRQLVLPRHWADGEAFVAFLNTHRTTDCLIRLRLPCQLPTDKRPPRASTYTGPKITLISPIGNNSHTSPSSGAPQDMCARRKHHNSSAYTGLEAYNQSHQLDHCPL